MRILIGFLMILLLTACQDKPTIADSAIAQTDATQEKGTLKPETTNVACINKNTLKKSPPVLDKSKIKAMLLKSGKITAEMTAEQADKIVNDFIRAKQKPRKNCN
ncbi:hypothetical protein ACOYR1_00385 [Thalassotalea piscium]